mgnify:CR=1 FL=1
MTLGKKPLREYTSGIMRYIDRALISVKAYTQELDLLQSIIGRIELVTGGLVFPLYDSGVQSEQTEMGIEMQRTVVFAARGIIKRTQSEEEEN